MAIHKGLRRSRGAHTKRSTHGTERAPPKERQSSDESESEDEAKAEDREIETAKDTVNSSSSEGEEVEKSMSKLTVEDKKPAAAPAISKAKKPEEMSRREREAMEKERARQHFLAMKQKEDAARLAEIKKRREEEAARRSAEAAAKEEDRLARRFPQGY